MIANNKMCLKKHKSNVKLTILMIGKIKNIVGKRICFIYTFPTNIS